VLRGITIINKIDNYEQKSLNGSHSKTSNDTVNLLVIFRNHFPFQQINKNQSIISRDIVSGI